MLVIRKKSLKFVKYIAFGLLFLVCYSCGGEVNLFSIQDDKDMGMQIDDEIEANPETYPILSELDYPDAYTHLRRIRDNVLASGQVAHADEFLWQVHIIEDDETLNAFAVPGGYLYFYTGLIKFLDSEDEFAGVMAHEMAHAAERHTTDALTKQYGFSILAEIILGENQNILTDIALGLTSLAFTRADETDADTHSVIYLAETDYDCTGAAGFFEKIEGEPQPPEFLSTHPSPSNRIENIDNQASILNCSTTPSGNDYQAFVDSLP